ncbi:MAG: alpha/beta hydrolase, partial [Bacteroidota bacterium]
LTAAQKAGIVFFGVSNPRPVNSSKPLQPYETITLQSNKQLECWYIKAKNAKGTVLLFHGYQGNKSVLIQKSDIFHEMGYNTLLVDFMGSGNSEGNQTTIGYKEAEEVKTCFDYITDKGEKNIYLCGNSMGAVAIMKAITDYNIAPKAIMIGCPFGSMYKTVGARFDIMGVPKFPMAGLLMFWGGTINGYWAFGHNPSAYAKTIKCPILLVYGAKDNRVNRAEIDNIYSNLAGSKTLKVYQEGGHDFLNECKDEWAKDIAIFLKKIK